jgi:hypothetical protein
LPFLRRLVETSVFRDGRYDTAFIETAMSGGPDPLDDGVRELVLAAVGLCAASSPGAGRRFRVAIGKEEAVEVELLSVSNPIRARVGKRDVEFERSTLEPDSTIAMISNCDFKFRTSIVARKKGGFDVGLRDRVVRVKCQEDA